MYSGSIGEFDSDFSNLAKQETAALRQLFLSPYLGQNNHIRIRIAGVVLHIQVLNKKATPGWKIFRLATYRTARYVRKATFQERDKYLSLFPALRLVLCQKTDKPVPLPGMPNRTEAVWYGIPANYADMRFKIDGLVPVMLAEEVQLFDTVITRYDGTNCWFDRIDPKARPQNAAMMRSALQDSIACFAGFSPGTIVGTGVIESGYVTKEEREAFSIAYRIARDADIEARKDKDEERIKEALTVGGANYRSYVDRGDAYTIEYTVGGQQHRSTVRKSDLGVESAGICLNHTDKLFDLTSLVGVIREGQQSGQIVRVGDNINNEDREGEDL